MLQQSLSIKRFHIGSDLNEILYCTERKKEDGNKNSCRGQRVYILTMNFKNDNDDERNEAAKWTSDANERANNEAKTTQKEREREKKNKQTYFWTLIAENLSMDSCCTSTAKKKKQPESRMA